MVDDVTVRSAYRRDTERLIAERLPLAAMLFLGLVGVGSVFEITRGPDHWRAFLGIYLAEVALIAPVLLRRRELQRRGWLNWVNTATWAGVALLVHAYAAMTSMPRELLVVVGTCIMTGASLLMPWGIRGQAVLVAVTVLGSATSLWHLPPVAVGTTYLLFLELAGALVSLFGAYYSDLYRFAIFRAAAQREQASLISHSLVAVAREINDSLNAGDVMDRVAAVIGEALHASWVAIVGREPTSGVRRVVGSAGRLPAALAELGGGASAGAAGALIDRVLVEGDLVLSEAEAGGDDVALLQHWQTLSVFGAALGRHGAAIGLLLVGTQDGDAAASGQERRLFRAIVPHVAVALGNVQLLNDLRHANERKSEFLSTMSHELRTPLSVIIGYADLLREGAFGFVADDQAAVLARLRNNALVLLDLINATLEANRIEAGLSDVRLRDVNMALLLDGMRAETEQMPRQPEVALRWEIAPVPATVRIDPVKLKIVVRNLVGNALKFTPRGRVTVSVEMDAGDLRIEVRDTGVGIAAEELPRIFDMFHQSAGNAGGGVGLGLYIVRRLVEQLGGHVTATSQLGIGSLFRVSVPIDRAASLAASDPPHAVAAAPQQAAR